MFGLVSIGVRGGKVLVDVAHVRDGGGDEGVVDLSLVYHWVVVCCVMGSLLCVSLIRLCYVILCCKLKLVGKVYLIRTIYIVCLELVAWINIEIKNAIDSFTWVITQLDNFV